MLGTVAPLALLALVIYLLAFAPAAPAASQSFPNDPDFAPCESQTTLADAQSGCNDNEQFNLYGALSTEPTPLPLFDVLGKWATIRGYVLLEITGDPERLERGKKFVIEGLADGSFKPLIAKTFPLDQIVEAHRYLESNQQIGKVVVTV